MKKIAVVLFNLGGPDSLAAVEPFLFNLFSDKAIIRLKNPFRRWLAGFISSRRAPIAKNIYRHMGGKSPILEQTQEQAALLEEKLNAVRKDSVTHRPSTIHYKTFISMRYWHPMSAETVAQVKDHAPEEIILLPLYPQYSTTTTASSFDDWDREAARQNLCAPTRRICCYPTQSGFIQAHADALKSVYEKALQTGPVRILFSAHGLPEKIIASGDPYQWQVEQSVAAVVEKLRVTSYQLPENTKGQESRSLDRESHQPAKRRAMEFSVENSGSKHIDHAITYQSRVGPMKWIGPATDAEIARAAEEGKTLVIVPIAFVSEHSETLVELDIEYKKLAEEHGCKHYFRVPALGIGDGFIESLASLVTSGDTRPRICPREFNCCGYGEIICHSRLSRNDKRKQADARILPLP